MQLTFYAIFVFMMALSAPAFAQGDSKCVTDKIQSIKGEQWLESPQYGLTCNPGRPDFIKGCVNREVKTQSFPFDAPEGWNFDPDTARFDEKSRNEHSHNSQRFTESSSKKITTEVHCNGHGCGGEGRVWIYGKTDLPDCAGVDGSVRVICPTHPGRVHRRQGHGLA